MKLKVIDIKDNQDGTCNIVFDADEDFKKWFKEKENLKRWSHKRFNKFVVDAIDNTFRVLSSSYES